MLTLFYCPSACSMAPHLVLEDSGEKYTPRFVDCANGEQRTPAYLKMNSQGRVPVLQVDSGEYISENVAILTFLGKRFGLWSDNPVTEAKILSFMAWVASSVHPSQAHYRRPERYATDPSIYPNIQETGLRNFHNYLKQIDPLYEGKEWLFGTLTVADFYAFVLYTWGLQRGFPMHELRSYSAFNDRMRKRPAIPRVFADEKITV